MRLSHLLNIISGYIPPSKAIDLINQIYDISKSESVRPDQLPDHIRQQLEEKQKIDEQMKEADAILQIKNVRAKAINEHIKLKKELEKHGLSTDDIHKLLNVLINAKKYGFDGKEIAEKLYNFKFSEWKEKELKDKHKKLSKRISKYKETIPLAQLIYDMHISKSELISFKIAVNEAAETYGLSPSAAALGVINIISDYNKKGQLKNELSELSLQKYAINEFCSSRSQAIRALMNLERRGITEEQIISLSNILIGNQSSL